jgi:hypothetical protein
VPLNLPTVTTPLPIHAGDNADLEADEILDGILHETLHEILDGTLCKATNPHGERKPCENLGSTKETTIDRGTRMGIETFLEGTGMTELRKDISMPRHLLQAVKSPCPRGIELLNQLNTATMRIPANVPLATPAHRLSDFSADPHTCIASPEEDIEEGDWPILNTMLKTAFRWGELEMEENAKSMLNCSEHGLDGFIQFFKYFVLERSLKGVMIETKVEALLHQLDKQ